MSIDAISAIAGLLVGGSLSALVRVFVPNKEVVWLRSELLTANDRLYAVSREPGALVPPRPSEPVSTEPQPLDAELQSIVDDHDDRGKAVVENIFRRQRENGISVKECIRRYMDTGLVTS